MSASQPINMREMAIEHRLLRTAFDESAQLVRAAPTPSRRVTLLADQIDLPLAGLHTYHENADMLLYTKLIERVPEQTR
jgi:hypothetical protein